ncbi:hypothetical protein DYL61_16490 [Pseudomonas nabeulensis]|uniref:DUF3077 domain-containing protein n=1 Tax=Pseudomonas nabeulensis TaxID=2293833 RepID=A0A4Z0B1P6_9PSED|nr:hypothetical protein [Pseudomonas nabeulensis]TFY92992.1 hypothetical protein DYL61_16490 [Pseudomonas nabeulensis]
MKTDLLTLESPFYVHGISDVLSAAGGVPIHDSLDAATSLLESVVAGLRDLMTEQAASHQATLVWFAAESALALVYAAHASVDPETGGDV